MTELQPRIERNETYQLDGYGEVTVLDIEERIESVNYQQQPTTKMVVTIHYGTDFLTQDQERLTVPEFYDLLEE